MIKHMFGCTDIIGKIYGFLFSFTTLGFANHGFIHLLAFLLNILLPVKAMGKNNENNKTELG